MTEQSKDSDNNKPDGEGQVVGYFAPKGDTVPGNPIKKIKTPHEEFKAFRQAFYDMLDHNGEGLFTRYLFHEAPQNGETGKSGTAQKNSVSSGKPDIYGTLDKHFGKLLYGAEAWHEHIAHSKTYDIVSSDKQALKYAIDRNIALKIPGIKHIVEYGPGDKSGVDKSKMLIDAFTKAAKGSVERYVAVDINGGFAIDAAKSIHDAFDIRVDAIRCDFMATEKINIPPTPEMQQTKEHTNVSFVFGGTFANAPDYSLSGGKDSKQNVVVDLSRMNRQFGIGSCVVMTYNAEDDSTQLMRKYQPTDAFSAFVLSAFTRAVSEGVIADNAYDPFRYWEMKPHYDAKDETVRLCAVCREDHSIVTDSGTRHVGKGENLSCILSYKWEEDDYRPLFEKAGYEIVEIYREGGAAHGVILARSVRTPAP